ncbi:MAG: TrkA C-terminal domain-containing protein [Deltaproteobacteria bacterium]|nr:TrkA C-terminal domain-containing protein [Deltaproteobacteria bacterium]
MVGVFLLPLVVLGAYIVVVAGATAYELTGLDRETARFQALSAFTGTGFTTRVSELVVSHPLRRRITSTLIITGYASTATVVASLVASVGRDTVTETASNLLLLVPFALLLYLGLRYLGPNVVGDTARRYLAPRLTGDSVPHEELLLYKKGFGITRIEIPPGSRVAGRSLRQLDLRAQRLQVLAVEETHDVHPVPDPDWIFAVGQHLIVYGDLSRLQEAFAPGGLR